jgi:hypothetical protein
MKIFAFVIAVLLFSCNQASKSADGQPASLPAAPVTPEDTTITKLRAAVLQVEMAELKATSELRQIKIDSVQYNMISMKEYYTVQKQELAKIVRLSTNKEKTTKALEYLDKMIARSPADLKIYAVQFHLNALLANTTRYNEHHTKYLQKDLTEISLIFP